MNAFTTACRCLASFALSSLAFSQVIIEVPPQVIPPFFRLNSGETLNVRSGGEVTGSMTATSGSVVNIYGGLVAPRFTAAAGSEVNISGGRVGSVDSSFLAGFSAAQGSVVKISGGEVGDGFSAASGSQVTLSGGRVGLQFQAASGSTELIGGDFRLDGLEYTGANVTLNRNINPDAVFTGTLADGSPFIFSHLTGGRQFGDALENLALTRTVLPPQELTPRIVDGSTSESPSGLRAGQELTLKPGGVLPSYFTTVDGTLTIEGGAVGKGMEAAGSVINITGGKIGQFFNTYAGSTVNISGGEIGFRFEARDTSVTISGGHVGDWFAADSGSVITITGGQLNSVRAYSGSVVNINGGTIGYGGNIYGSMAAVAGSEVKVAGGSFAPSFRTTVGSKVELIGGDFKINGNSVPDSAVTLAAEDILTGTFADGSSFLFTPLHGDDLQAVTLTSVPLPPIDLTSTEISHPLTNGPVGLRPGQSVTLKFGGKLQDNFAVIGGTLNVEAGDAGRGVEVFQGVLNIDGGEVGSGLSLIDGVVNLTGGSIGERSSAQRGSIVNLSGGVVGSKFSAGAGSEVNISGGSVGRDFRAYSGSDVELIGNDFRLNGLPYDGGAINMGSSSTIQTFTGTLQDGSTFVFSPSAAPLGDSVNGVRLTRVALPPADLAPRVVESPLMTGPSGLRSGQTLSVKEGGVLPDNFAVLNATLNVEGGVVGDWMESVGGTINVSGGEVGGGLWVVGGELNISGGRVGNSIVLSPGSTANITGGDIGSFNANGLSTVNISGGNFESFYFETGASQINITGGKFDTRITTNTSVTSIAGGSFDGEIIHSRGVMNISGGTFRGLFEAGQQSVTNLIGDRFYLDGVPIDGLMLDQPLAITERGGTLTGFLADGSFISLGLNDTRGVGRHYFRQGSTLTVTLSVPEPQSLLVALIGTAWRWRVRQVSSMVGPLQSVNHLPPAT